ncbi:MAG: stage III sporulation protein AF [Clostridia bacterium]|nr:stage III sporulation protein AF [Clostridia bacterium]MBQ7101246.1 stage III sporulation protein AF [Clostridia bacterium]
MDNLKSWAVCAVVSSAVAAVVELLVPEGGGEKPVKFITSVFVLLAFVSPFADFEALSVEYTRGVDEFVEEYELQKQVEEQAKQSLESQIESMLSAYTESLGAVCRGVDADVVINYDKEIYLEAVTVYISGGDEEIKHKLTEYSIETFGILPTVKERE